MTLYKSYTEEAMEGLGRKDAKERARKDGGDHQ